MEYKTIAYPKSSSLASTGLAQFNGDVRRGGMSFTAAEYKGFHRTIRFDKSESRSRRFSVCLPNFYGTDFCIPRLDIFQFFGYDIAPCRNFLRYS